MLAAVEALSSRLMSSRSTEEGWCLVSRGGGGITSVRRLQLKGVGCGQGREDEVKGGKKGITSVRRLRLEGLREW